MKKIPILLAAMFLITSFIVADTASGIEDINIEDAAGDVIMTETIERTVSGYGEIDIVSLTSVEDLTTVTVTLATVDDISSDDDHSYYLSIGDIYVDFSDGEFDIDSFSSSTSATGEVNGNELVVTIPRSELNATWFFFSANTRYYDWGSFDDNSATYSDDIDMDPFFNFTRSVGSFDKEITDDTGDVLESTYEETPVSNRHDLDILSISLTSTGSGTITLEMELSGPVSTDPLVTYSIYMDDASVDYSGGTGTIFYYDDGHSSDTLSHSGTVITVILDASRISSTDYINAEAEYYDRDEGIEIYDDAGSNAWGDLDGLLDMEMSVKIEFREIDEIEIRFSITYGEGNLSRLMRQEMDTNSDGTITEEELEEQVNSEDMMEPIDPDLISMDGKAPEVETDIEYSGLIGSSELTSPVTVTMITTMTFDLDEKDNHTFRIGGENTETSAVTRSDTVRSSEGSSSSLFATTFEIILPSGWDVDQDTVRPSGLKDHIEDGRIILDPEDLDEIGMDDSDEMSITFIKGNGEKEPGKIPFGTMIPISAICLVGVLMILIGFRKR